MQWLKAAVIYFVLVFAAGFVLGPIRELILKPKLGGLAAVLVEAPLMITVMLLVAPRAKRWAGLHHGLSAGAAMGLAALALVCVAEIAASRSVRGWSISDLIAHFQTAEGIVGIALYVVFAAIPLLSRARATERAQ